MLAARIVRDSDSDRFATRSLLVQEKDRASWKADESFCWSCDFHEHSFFCVVDQNDEITSYLLQNQRQMVYHQDRIYIFNSVIL